MGSPFLAHMREAEGVCVCMWQAAGGVGVGVVMVVWRRGDGELEGRQKKREGKNERKKGEEKLDSQWLMVQCFSRGVQAFNDKTQKII